MSETSKIIESPEKIEVQVMLERDTRVIADAIGKVTEALPSSTGIENALTQQNEIFSSLVELASASAQPDYIPYFVSFASIVISLVALYLSHWHKSSKAVLCLNSRLFDCLDNKTKRQLSYTFSNTGNQELFVKNISLLRGQSPLGNLKHSSSYLVIPSNAIEPFVIKPGEIKSFMLSHEVKHDISPDYDKELNKYIVVSLEVISANGKRFQVTHDISNLGSTGPDIKDKIWAGVPLGASI